MEIRYCERPLAPAAAHVAMPAVRVFPAAALATVAQVHQVPTRVERALMPASVGSQGTNGFTARAIGVGIKGSDDRGVPPRGRPV
jgi:hypothetical protein